MTRKIILESKQSVGGADATYRLHETGVAQEIYIDGMQGLTVAGPIVKINCFTRGSALPAQGGAVEEREIVCRLVMGTDTFSAVAEWLRQVEAELRTKLAATQSTDKNGKGS